MSGLCFLVSVNRSASHLVAFEQLDGVREEVSVDAKAQDERVDVGRDVPEKETQKAR